MVRRAVQEAARRPPSTPGLNRRSGRVPALPCLPIKPLHCTAVAENHQRKNHPLWKKTAINGRRPKRTVIIAAIAAAIAMIAVLPFPIRRSPRQELKYQQITNFTDSVVSPALSPDARMVAFIRGDNWFQSRDPIYVKML